MRVTAPLDAQLVVDARNQLALVAAQRQAARAQPVLGRAGAAGRRQGGCEAPAATCLLCQNRSRSNTRTLSCGTVSFPSLPSAASSCTRQKSGQVCRPQPVRPRRGSGSNRSTEASRTQVALQGPRCPQPLPPTRLHVKRRQRLCVHRGRRRLALLGPRQVGIQVQSLLLGVGGRGGAWVRQGPVR